MYTDTIFPKLHAHQQVLLVPGIFACSNLTYFPLENQSTNLVKKLDGYMTWAKAEPRIAGFNPWCVTVFDSMIRLVLALALNSLNYDDCLLGVQALQ
jgi:hypothetical protein